MTFYQLLVIAYLKGKAMTFQVVCFTGPLLAVPAITTLTASHSELCKRTKLKYYSKGSQNKDHFSRHVNIYSAHLECRYIGFIH